MNVIEYALQMELDGRDFYRRSAQAAPNSELRKILLNLADEEDRHYQFFKKLKEGDDTSAASALMAKSHISSANRTIFKELAEQGKQASFTGELRQVWTEALKIEEQVEQMYRKEAGKESDPARKKLYNLIADEEKSHVYLIDNILSFLADPQGFTESSRFKSFLSWEGR